MGKKSKKKGADKPAETFEPKYLAATGDNAVDLLEEVGDKAPALVDAWVRESNALAVHAVAYAEDAPALARKTARRGLNVLKARGVPIPERAKRAPVVTEDSAAACEAWFLAPDQSGVSVFTIGTRAAGVNYDIVDVQLHERAGVIDVRVGEATRSGIRNAFKNIEAQRGYGPVPVPVEWARWHIQQAKQRNASSGLIMPLGFDTSAHLLQPVPESEPTHPIDQQDLAVDDAQITERMNASGNLHNDPEFRNWLPEIEHVNELLQRVGEKIGPNPDQEPEKVNDVLKAELDSATDRFFTPEVREKLAERMRDAAISVYARKGRERALDVLATAEAAKRAGLITSPPSEIPFLKNFFNKALALVAASQGGKLNIPVSPGAQQAPGVVAPREALEEAERTRAGRQDAEAQAETVVDAEASDES